MPVFRGNSGKLSDAGLSQNPGQGILRFIPDRVSGAPFLPAALIFGTEADVQVDGAFNGLHNLQHGGAAMGRR
jgi:hypothetical protein